MPWDFERLTPWEFRQLLAGHRARTREIWHQLAQHAAWLLAPYSRRRLSAKSLIKLPPDPLLAADDEDDHPVTPARRRARPSHHG